MKLRFAALAALLIAGGARRYTLKLRQGNPTFRFLSLEYLELASRLRNSADTKGRRIANTGSIASALRTENTKCAIGWQPPMATI